MVAPSRPNRISPELVGKVGHETDYSWITGQLRIENGRYVIHYAAPEVIDAHNGSLVLSSDRDLRGFQDGDFVSVRIHFGGQSQNHPPDGRGHVVDDARVVVVPEVRAEIVVEHRIHDAVGRGSAGNGRPAHRLGGGGD